jgi:hypothetical protein
MTYRELARAAHIHWNSIGNKQQVFGSCIGTKCEECDRIEATIREAVAEAWESAANITRGANLVRPAPATLALDLAGMFDLKAREALNQITAEGGTET